MESEGMNLLINSTVLITVFIGACVLLLMYIIKLLNADQKNVEHKRKNEKLFEQTEKKKDSGASSKTKKKSSEPRWSGRSDKQSFSHPWLLTTLKGHTSQVLDMEFSSSGKYLASCGEDRAVLLWDTKDLTQKDHKSLRINIEFDHPTFVKWSPDSKAFIIHKYNANAIEVYKVEKKKDGWLGSATKALTFPKVHEEDAVGLGIACNGKFIMTCSNKTDLVVWDLRGQQLARVDTYLMSTACAKISPCGRFIVASGFAPDVKVWEVIFNKAGEYQEVKRVFELTGHTSGVHDVAFDVDTSHMATVSKDGTWKLFDTKVDYKKGEDPHLKITSKYEQTSRNARIALSPNAEVVAIATWNSLSFYSTHTGRLDGTIENIFSGDITSIMFDSLGKYLLVSGDKHIRVFHNVTGYRCEVATAKEKLKQNQTSATRERLEKLICDNEAFLNRLGLKL
ncbi:hypothetical protein ILUMI_10640 [Ignelater luminosus]|uniref:Transducin beta-like protein 2 n=1 Tax=Ignelater luminosus TaxID=2038154 RepID=A0A8K0CXI7_IGNLU|nr:hypothetical protein ILUMI_10640 [Ignelater luminosus]